MEKLSRRKFLRSAAAVPLASLLKIDTAYAAQQIDCPIYMFHLTGAAPVEQVIRSNAAAGRKPITVGQLGKIILGEEEIPSDPVFCLTFDDGYLVQYQQALPVLERYEAPATFFVMGTGWQGDGVHNYMSHNQLIDLYQKGHEIGSHTINHDPNLIALRARNRGAYLGEIFTSQTQLQELLNDEITSFCYPNGVFDAGIIQDVSSAYKVAASILTGNRQSSDIAYTLRRQRIN